MDYGIRGRTAIVCAASQGLGKGCAQALAGEGVNLVINARSAEALNATADEIRRASGVSVTAVAADITTPRRARRRTRRLPVARHPGQQRRRPADRRLPRLGRGHLAEGRQRQHGDADHADPRRRRRHDRAALRPHRQHHVAVGQGAARASRPVERRARRAHRLRRGLVAPGREAQRRDQQPAAGAIPHRAAEGRPRQARREGGTGSTTHSSPRASPRTPPGASARRRSSAAPARSCAARTPASSSARTSSSTAAR